MIANMSRFPFSYATEGYVSPWRRDEMEAEEERRREEELREPCERVNGVGPEVFHSSGWASRHTPSGTGQRDRQPSTEGREKISQEKACAGSGDQA